MLSNGSKSDVIVFFDRDKVIKEMLYVEFEAVLDRVVGIAEFANQQKRAAFVRVNDYLDVTAVVFFLIDFHDKGYADTNWNIPLQHMADTSGLGPDLGAGHAIRLACRSQCNVPWHQRQLWDPDLNQHQTLLSLQKRLKENRLCLESLEDTRSLNAEPPVLTQVAGSAQKSAPMDNSAMQAKFKMEYEKKFAAMVKEQQLQVSALKSELKSRAEELHKRYSATTQRLKEELALYKQSWDDEKHHHESLKKKLAEQAETFALARDNFEKQLADNQQLGSEQLATLKEQYANELKAEYEAKTLELQESLYMRDVELSYREEQFHSLRNEISRLREEKMQLLRSSDGRLIERLADQGVSFVTYHPGIDHLTIPVQDVPRYLESPEHYVAEKCGVSYEHYHAWLGHYSNPVCQGETENGERCQTKISRVNFPAQFIAGEHDCCEQHAHKDPSTSSIDRAS